MQAHSAVSCDCTVPDHALELHPMLASQKQIGACVHKEACNCTTYAVCVLIFLSKA